MKKSIGSFEAKTHFAAILQKVAKGESFTITKRGRPIAILSPTSESNSLRIDEAVEQIRELRKKYKLNSLSIKKLISEGRS